MSGPARAQDVETIIDGVDFVTGIAFSPDGETMYFNEREGRVYAVTGRRPRLVATIPTTTAGETGLLGIAVHPRHGDLYVFATDPGGASNNVLRLDRGEPEVVVSGLPASVYHNGGGVAFDRQGNLLVSNGEIHDSSAAQDPDQLGGKIYRFTPSGSAARGNPFGDAIALGLRNPYGLTVDPMTGDAFVTDNGPSSHDEVNRVRVGGNYGWPDVLGFSDGTTPTGPGKYFDPISVQEEIVVPTGIAVADPSTARDDVAGDVFYGTFGEQTVRRVRLDDTRSRAVSDRVFIRESEGVVALAWGPEGLYYSTTSAIKLVRLARPERKRESPVPTPEPRRTIVGPPLEPDDGGPPWRVIAAGAAVVTLALVLLLAVRSRSRSDPSR